MPQPKTLTIPFILSSLVFLSHAQDLEETIVGCEAVGCPMDNFEPHCTLTNITFENIGLARIPDVPDSLDNFSIVKGVNISGAGANDFTSVYYLGTPEDVSLDDVHGCAVIFHDPPQDRFEQGGSHTCSEVISQSCIDAIQDRAVKVAEGNFDDLCKAVKEDLEDNDISECENLTGGGKGIGQISSRALSSLENINGSRNSTSDCWPILPKSANLAQLFTEVGGLNASTAYPELNRITPLLTLFIKSDGSGNVVDETVSRLTCIAINTTQTVGEEGSDNVASLLSVNTFVVGSAFASFVFMLL
ncbi:hypothetical protein BGZ61DRAFT_415830 [Ilyonectria robusta]|uniref:uncharacterized protein n=1 Tax=Ilyonectria robusta TaxID=1079257 RepID=UPI001E8DD335|nr:uncharacterized protein BGZ61DRAFT_415830 [Ilyonectria robusta]KAH8729935.1 hypothetical protein BGZ61DRAFT_415830 [Ilyonectria robusta]